MRQHMHSLPAAASGLGHRLHYGKYVTVLRKCWGSS